MKKIIYSTFFVVVVTFSLYITQACCTKTCEPVISKTDTIKVYIHDTTKLFIHDTICPPKLYKITGLWEGKVIAGSGFPTPGAQYYKSLSIYPDGTLSYKSSTNTTGFYVYGEGTWTLTGNTLNYTCKTINASGITTVNGTATFDATNAKLTNGSFSTISPVTNGTEDYTKVKD